MINQAPRAVVTGMGVLAANGIGVASFWDSLVAGRSGIGPITHFDASEFPIRMAGEVSGFDVNQFVLPKVKPKRLGRHTQLALAAVQMGLDDAGLSRADLAAAGRLPLYVGVSTSAIDVVEHAKELLIARGPHKISPYIVSECQPNAVVSAIRSYLDVSTSPMTYSTACAAGLDALAAAARGIRSGHIDLAVVVGTDSPLNPLTVASFAATGLVPELTDDPRTASCPFDLKRAGGIMAEGAAVLVLESWSHAMARGATPVLEILGYGTCCDDVGAETASGLRYTMQQAIEHSGLHTDEIDYISAHSPSDPVIDRVETAAIKAVFGSRAYRFPVSSVKGVTGNPLSAIGPIQAIACALGLKHGLVPPTANYSTPDPECDLDIVPGQAYAMQYRRALINVHGMGGGNSSLVVQAVS